MNDTYQARPAASGSNLAIPAAIIIGFALIALSIYLSNGKTGNVLNNGATPEETIAGLESIDPITADDHIRGNPNAPLMIVEYSDFDCPFCKSFHVTMQKIIEEYGPSGKVAWVYRQLPLTSLHPSAAYIAEASECVADLGGNESFWKFADMVFGERGPNDLTDLATLPAYAEVSGVGVSAYEECLESGRTRGQVEADMLDAQNLGARGTPYSVIIVGDQKMVINGAESYERMKILIDGLVE
jgi:protein-disulfide isomerase